MAQQFFQIADALRATILGGYPAKNADELCTGVLAKLNTDGTLQAATASDAPTGFVITERFLVYAPTSQYAAANEYVAVASGDVLALADASFFSGGTLPSAGDLLYSAASGLMATSGSKHIGKVLSAHDYRTPPSTTSNVVMIQCRFSGKD